jgi:hypothetical protein
MINSPYIKTEPTEFNCLLFHINKKCLVSASVILSNNQNSIVLRRRERKYCLQTDIHLAIIDIDQVEG